MWAAGLGAATIGGLSIALLRVLVGNDSLRGPAFALFDVYGWAILAGIAVAVAAAVVVLLTPSPGERLAAYGRRLLPNPESWFRARVAQLPRAAVAGLGAAVVTFLVVGSIVFVTRASDASFTPPDTAVVRLAQATIYGLFAFMVLNLVRSRASSDSLRRVGSVWDVLTFWPRRFHPFAVRAYTALAVPQLRELLADPSGVDEAWRREPLTVLAHSQGTMLVVAALAPYGAARGGSRVSHLVTVGSPLRPLYMKAFPAYVDDALVRDVSSALTPPARWTNVFRFTDHVGRSVFCEDPAWLPVGQTLAGDPPGLWWAEAGPPFGPGNHDCAVADPESNQALIDGHNNYWTDRRVRGVIDDAPAGRP